MIVDFFKALRAGWKFFLRERRYRAEKRKRASLPDPLQSTFLTTDMAAREMVKRIHGE